MEDKSELVDKIVCRFEGGEFHMKSWFTIDVIDAHTHIISEYRHCEETHCDLLE